MHYLNKGLDLTCFIWACRWRLTSAPGVDLKLSFCCHSPRSIRLPGRWHNIVQVNINHLSATLILEIKKKYRAFKFFSQDSDLKHLTSENYNSLTPYSTIRNSITDFFLIKHQSNQVFISFKTKKQLNKHPEVGTITHIWKCDFCNHSALPLSLGFTSSSESRSRSMTPSVASSSSSPTRSGLNSNISLPLIWNSLFNSLSNVFIWLCNGIENL